MPKRDRMDDAVVAALWSIRNAPVEHMGALYGDDLLPSNTVTTGGTSRVKGRLTIPGGASAIRALFHNHPPDKRDKRDGQRARFSPEDKTTAKRLGVPSYIAAGDRVMRYDPSTGETSEVLAQFPIEYIRALRKIHDGGAQSALAEDLHAPGASAPSQKRDRAIPFASDSPALSREYDTLEDAAMAALLEIERTPKSAMIEHGAVLVRNPESGRFFYAPIVKGDRGSVSAQDMLDAATQFGVTPDSIVARVHSHPGPDPRGRRFSLQDAKSDRPEFLIHIPGRLNGVAQPVSISRLPTKGRKPASGGTVEGEQFLAQFPIEEFRENLMRRLLDRAPSDPRGLTREQPQAVTPRRPLVAGTQ